MMRGVPAGARELAVRLSALFVAYSRLAERQNHAQRRLLGASDRLWSGFCPDALGLLNDGARRVVGCGGSTLAGPATVARSAGGEHVLTSATLEALGQTHSAIRSAFVEYQGACEERRQLACDVGELAARLEEALTGAGWSEEAARMSMCTSWRGRGRDDGAFRCAVLGRF